MQFIKPDINIDFIGKRNIAFYFSALLIFVSLISLLVKGGPQYGIDFAGGTLIQIKFASPVEVADVKSGLERAGVGFSSVQQFGDPGDHEFLIRADEAVSDGEDAARQISDALQAASGERGEVRRVEMVGPQVGQDLREKALLAMFFALLFITIYISGRFELKWMVSGVMAGALMLAVYLLKLFHLSIPVLMLAALIITLILFWFLELRYAMGAIAALIHDVAITVGVFSIFGKEFTLPIVAALLTIIGYSLNDTIIVFDRIRENLRKHHRQRFDFIINRSINETLGRTILTSTTTLIVLVILFVMGGDIIHDFAFALIIGVLIGTYSSVYVASPILLAWHKRRK